MWRLGSGQECSRDNMETSREFVSWMSAEERNSCQFCLKQADNLTTVFNPLRDCIPCIFKHEVTDRKRRAKLYPSVAGRVVSPSALARLWNSSAGTRGSGSSRKYSLRTPETAFTSALLSLVTASRRSAHRKTSLCSRQHFRRP